MMKIGPLGLAELPDRTYSPPTSQPTLCDMQYYQVCCQAAPTPVTGVPVPLDSFLKFKIKQTWQQSPAPSL